MFNSTLINPGKGRFWIIWWPRSNHTYVISGLTFPFVRYHTTTVQRADVHCLMRCFFKWGLRQSLWEGVWGWKSSLLEWTLVQPPWKPVGRFPRKLKIELAHEPVIPLLGADPDKTLFQKMHAPQCSRQHRLQQPRHGSDLSVHQQEWIRKPWYMHPRGHRSATRKNETVPFTATWVRLEVIILSEVSQKDKDKCHMMSLRCGI